MKSREFDLFVDLGVNKSHLNYQFQDLSIKGTNVWLMSQTLVGKKSIFQGVLASVYIHETRDMITLFVSNT
jgi:hypothetical protein